LTFLKSKRIVASMFRNSQHSGAARVAPVEPPFEPEVDLILRSMMPEGVAPIGLFRTFARNVPMTSAMRTWGRYELSPALSLTLRDREIVIDRTCARCACEYEWGVHVAYFAERATLTATQVDSLAHGTSDDACWTDERDRVLIDAVDALHDDATIDDDLWRRVAAVLTEPEIIDLLLLCGWYHAIAFAANALRVEPEEWAPRLHDGEATSRADRARVEDSA
jgi:alkylhydroperoxidase family enzyme